ncbi:MAG: single-stranded DNA-binding protein, partial [Alphaproteobacteria bacterium]|nr:single-stranded DNA-binding protein [Alphaproteobacteria bacterium]
ISGKLRTRKWRKAGGDSDRFATEIVVGPRGCINFLDPKRDGTGSGNHPPAPPPEAYEDDFAR